MPPKSFLETKLIEYQKIFNSYELPSLLLVYFMMGRMHMFRYVRRYSLPIFGLGICYYRYQDKDSSSFISQLATLFESLKLNVYLTRRMISLLFILQT
jgi:hypothetical protein